VILRDLPHPLQGLVGAAAERVHQDALGLVHDGPGLGRVPELPHGPPRLLVLRGDADDHPSEGDDTLGDRDRGRGQHPGPRAEQ
jgi:hypothetical protein